MGFSYNFLYILQRIIQEADKNKSGKIEFNEFQGAMECIAVLCM